VSAVTHETETGSMPDPVRSAFVPTERSRPRATLYLSVLVMLWSFAELANLVVKHTTGPELYGVLAAAIASAAGIATVALLRPRGNLVAVVIVLAVWAFVALAGIAGTVAHIVGAPIGEGPIDPRPRPVAAPLVFTLLACLDGAALAIGRRTSLRKVRNPWKE